MAFNSTLPPQAYTREVLAAAYIWLQKQPEGIRKLATSPDALAGLYLRAQRFGTSNIECEAPVSSQSFISDLKNLASDIRQFEGQEKPSLSPPAPAPTFSNPTQKPIQKIEEFESTNPQASVNAQQNENPLNSLNAPSYAMLNSVRCSLNLSSDAETLNLMIAVAYKNLKSLLA